VRELDPWPLGRYPHAPARIYRDLLFHGPRFQLIRGVAGLSQRGMAADVDGVDGAGWDGAWTTDAAALDAALQLAALWTRHHTGRAALPTGIDGCVLRAPAAGPLRVVLVGRSAHRDGTVSDLVIRDREERTVAALTGVHLHALPTTTYPS
jgi:hypothetical protein